MLYHLKGNYESTVIKNFIWKNFAYKIKENDYSKYQHLHYKLNQQKLYPKITYYTTQHIENVDKT